MEKLCLTCNEPLVQRNHESLLRYSRKQWCSAECYRTWSKGRKVGFRKYDDRPKEFEDDKTWWARAEVRIQAVIEADRIKRMGVTI